MRNLKKKKKGFFSIDGLFAIIMLLLVVGTMINIYQGRSQMATQARKNLEGKMIGEKLAGAVNSVYSTGEPMTLNIDLPENIIDDSYSIIFDETSRRIVLRHGVAGDGSEIARSWSVPSDLNISDLDFSEEIQIFWENSMIKVNNA